MRSHNRPTHVGCAVQADTARLEWFVYVHYLSKYLDFFDTVFIILRGATRAFVPPCTLAPFPLPPTRPQVDLLSF
jgi:hypothetical protein